MCLPRLFDPWQSQSHHKNAKRKTRHPENKRHPLAGGVLLWWISRLDVEAEVEDIAIHNIVI